jgi:hypothetical protein
MIAFYKLYIFDNINKRCEDVSQKLYRDAFRPCLRVSLGGLIGYGLYSMKDMYETVVSKEGGLFVHKMALNDNPV